MLQTIKMLMGTKYLPRRLQIRQALTYTKGKHYGVVLDIGAGKSPYRKLVSTDKYIATDIENRSGDPAVVISDANKTLPFEDMSFDLVILTEVIEHLHTPLNVLMEAHRVLKPGGTMIITAPMVWPLHEAPNDFYRYTYYGVSHLCHSAGFSNIELHPSNGPWYTTLAVFNSQLKGRFWIPLVLFVNFLGWGIERFEKNRTFPLGIHGVATK